MTPSTARLVRHPFALALAALLSACGTDTALHGPASPAGSDPTAAPAAAPAAPAPAPAPRVAVRQFSCIGMLSPPQTRQRVTGGLTASDEPVDVTFVKSSNSMVLAAGAEPQLDPAYDGGYWKTTYGFEAWTVATTDVGTWTLLFPRGPYAFRFDAMAITDYGAGGNYQDQLTCAIL